MRDESLKGVDILYFKSPQYTNQYLQYARFLLLYLFSVVFRPNKYFEKAF